MQKLVKELRFGAPKTGKTSSVGNTYPTPILIFNFDPSGFDSISKRKVEVVPPGKLRLTDLPEVLVIDYTSRPASIMMGKERTKSSEVMTAFIGDVNSVLDKDIPFKTVVLDSYSGLDDAIISYIFKLNPDPKNTLQSWGYILNKKEEIVTALLAVRANVVVFAHTESKKDELTGAIREVPYGSGKLQEKIGVYFSQVLYSTVESVGGKPKYVVYTKPKGTIGGLGMRFPQDAPDVTGPEWGDLYEKYYKGQQ